MRALVCASAAALRSGDDQDASQAVEDEGEEEEDEAELDQRLEIKVAGGFGEFVGDDGGDGVAGRKERGADGGRVADDHGDGHGFAESAREREEDGAHDAGAGEGDDHFPGGFPTRGAESESGFALIARDGEKNFTRDRDDVRNHHDGEDDAGREEADAVGGAGEKREEAERVAERGLNVFAHHRDDDEDAEQAVDDAGDGGEKIDEELQRVGDARGSEFGEEDGGADAERDGDDQRDDGGDERAVDEGKRAEVAGVGIPNSGEEEIEAELVTREDGAASRVRIRADRVMRTVAAAKTKVMRRAISSPSRRRSKNEREPETGPAL